MKLLLVRGWQGREELISGNPTEEIISELMGSLDWQTFHSVWLEKDKHNWTNVSGNLDEEGLAIVYEENGRSFLSDSALDTIEQLTETLCSYLRGDQKFKEFGFSSFDTSETLKKKSGDYELWKVRYEAKRKTEKINSIMAVFVALALTIFACSIGYLMYNDELKFIGHHTDHTIARVVEIKLRPVSGGYYQQVTYEFDYQGKTFKGYYKGTKFTGRQEIGDRVKVKFATGDPSVSKRTATLKEEY